jgi:tetratricopeptide (TPR) repeat protein
LTGGRASGIKGTLMSRPALLVAVVLGSILACRSALPPGDGAPAIRADFENPQPAVDAYLRIARHRYSQGDVEGALTALDGAAARAPNSGSVQLARAELLAQPGKEQDTLEAQRLVDEVAATYPEAPRLRRAQAEIQLGAGSPDAAWETIEPALSDSQDPALHTLAAETLLALGREPEARDEAERALEQEPANSRALKARARTRRHLGDDAGAVNDARRALRHRSKDPELRLLLAECLLRTGKPGSARKTLAALAPADRTVRSEYLSGEIALAAGDAPAAREAYERALELEPADSETLHALVELDLAEGDPTAALERLGGSSGDGSSVLRARALIASGRADEARAELRAALEQDPNDVEAWGVLASEAPSSGRPLERAHAAWGADESAEGHQETADTLLLAALLADDAGTAGPLYDRALAANPSLALAANNRASQLLDAGTEPERALELAAGAYAALPRLPATADTFGVALTVADRTDEAIEVFSRGLGFAIPRSDEAQSLHVHRALAREAHGDTDAALAEAGAALRSDESRVRAAERSGAEPQVEPAWAIEARALRNRHEEPDAPEEPVAAGSAPAAEPEQALGPEAGAEEPAPENQPAADEPAPENQPAAPEPAAEGEPAAEPAPADPKGNSDA